jgi:tetratricopeptide (TPR) repeat protein
MQKFQEALSYKTSGSGEYQLQLAQYVSEVVLNRQVNPEEARVYIDIADTAVLDKIEKNPFDAANYILAMRHYNNTYILEPERLYEVESFGEQALALSPTRPQIYYELGFAHFRLANWFSDNENETEVEKHIQLMIENFDRAIELNESVAESYLNIIMLLISSHHTERIPMYIDLMNERGVRYLNREPLERLANSAVTAKEFEWAVFAYQHLSELFPNEPDLLVSLALSYANLDQNDKAIEIAERIAIFGGQYADQSSTFIEQIRNGTFEKNL